MKMKQGDIKIGRHYLLRHGAKEIVVRVIRVGGQAARNGQYTPRRAWVVQALDTNVELSVKSPNVFLRQV